MCTLRARKAINYYTSGLSSVTLEHSLSCFARSAQAGHRCLPDAHYAVVISRGEACAVRRPGDREYLAAVIMVRQLGSACCALPYLNGLTGIG